MDAKAQLYRSNFRNDRIGLRAAIRQASVVRGTPAVAAMGLYYAAWGEWVLSHSELQDGDLSGAGVTLVRAESFVRAGLAFAAGRHGVRDLAGGCPDLAAGGRSETVCHVRS
jgi:hypothetical protein